MGESSTNKEKFNHEKTYLHHRTYFSLNHRNCKPNFSSSANNKNANHKYRQRLWILRTDLRPTGKQLHHLTLKLIPKN